MKLVYSIFIILLILPRAWADDSIPLDEFKKITDPVERAKLIDKASPEQKDRLKKVDLHLRLLVGLGGEDDEFPEENIRPSDL